MVHRVATGRGSGFSTSAMTDAEVLSRAAWAPRGRRPRSGRVRRTSGSFPDGLSGEGAGALPPVRNTTSATIATNAPDRRPPPPDRGPPARPGRPRADEPG